MVDAFDGPVYVAARPVLAEVTGYDVHRGALAAMDRRPLPSVDEVLSGARRIVVLEDVNDHTNVGAIFRSAAGLGHGRRSGHPALRRPALSAFGEGVDGRGVLGAVDATARRGPPTSPLLREAGFAVLALTPDAVGACRSASWHPKCGPAPHSSSAPKVPASQPRTLAEVGTRVRIPMSAGVDSLNVGAAAAVAFYALTR